LYNYITLTVLLLFLSLLFFLEKISFSFFFFLFFISFVFFLFFKKLQSFFSHKFRSDFEEIEEEINLLEESIREKKKKLELLPLKYEKVSSLFNTSQRLIELIDSEEIFDSLLKFCKDLFPQADNILIFLLQKEKLNLIRSAKKENLVIKEKEGDIVDKWVLKNNQCVVIEDLTKDFRFDYTKMICFKERKIFSLMSSPISIGEKLIGTIKVESRLPNQFSLEDSRILRSISDLGAVVLERAYFFKRAEELAIKDSLTSLFLKGYFFERLKEELKRAYLKKSNLGLIMLDIDDFKKINDTYGHIVGDMVLKKLAKVLVEVVGDAGNAICRFGGEEFIVFVVECKKEELISLGEEIRKRVEESVVVFRRKKVNFTVSLGLSLYPEDGREIIELVDKADQRLYKAKKEGKNRLCFSG
jgi:diguanylate cyclase (GGDEF)-like protein